MEDYAVDRRYLFRRRGIIAASILSMLFGGTAMAADASRGAQIFMQCRVCHSPDKGVNRVGPSLYGIINRPAGSISDYAYSPAMVAAAKKGLVWSPENIVEYLRNPHEYLGKYVGDPNARNKMPFSLADQQSREDVVAYLKTLSVGK